LWRAATTVPRPCTVTSSQIASAAFVMHAIDDDAFRFYRHFDFTPFPERRDQLFLPMATIASLF
jgi:hypothetical protein